MFTLRSTAGRMPAKLSSHYQSSYRERLAVAVSRLRNENVYPVLSRLFGGIYLKTNQWMIKFQRTIYRGFLTEKISNC